MSHTKLFHLYTAFIITGEWPLMSFDEEEFLSYNTLLNWDSDFWSYPKDYTIWTLYDHCIEPIFTLILKFGIYREQKQYMAILYVIKMAPYIILYTSKSAFYHILSLGFIEEGNFNLVNQHYLQQ